MNQIIAQIVQLLQQGIAALFRFLQIIWTWSFGQIISVFQSDWQRLPIWKIAVLALTVVAIVVVLLKAARTLWDAGEKLLRAFITLISAFITVLPFILIAGLIAFAGGYVIKSVNF